MSGDASTRGWGPGWPNPDTSKIVKLNLPGFGNAQRVRQEIAPLVEWLIVETERRGYEIRPEWTWGFSNRQIRGSSKPSNHSWGLALDINAPTNGMNRAGPGWATQHAAGKTDMPEWLPELWEAHGFRAGMNYTGRQDPMHMEFMGTPADAARYIAQTTQPEDDMYTDDDRKRDVATAKKVDTLFADYGVKGKGVRQTIAEIAQRTEEIAKGIRALLKAKG